MPAKNTRIAKYFKINCQYCNDEFEIIEREFKKRKKLNCKKRECILLARSNSGDKNGMFNRTHTEEVKQKLSEKTKKQFTGKSYEELYGIEKANELKKIRSNVFKKTWENENRTLSFLNKTHTEETKKIISKKSKEKFTPEYNDRIYKIGVETGRFIPEHLKSDWEIYNKKSNWIKEMWNFCDPLFLMESGIFNVSTNRKGLVRDHIYSRFDGFINGVYPEIIRHPMNCAFISHGENSKKRQKSHLTLEQLFSRIEEYTGEWVEHDIVLKCIEKYKNEERVNIEEYRRKEAS